MACRARGVVARRWRLGRPVSMAGRRRRDSNMAEMTPSTRLTAGDRSPARGRREDVARRVNNTQARSHGQGESKARAHRRRAISHRRRAAPGRHETRGSVVSRSTSTGRNVPAAPEPPNLAKLGGRQAAFTSTISPRARRDARPEARRRPRGVLLQAAPRRAVPRVHSRDGRRVAGVQARGARGAAAAEADVLPRPGLSLLSCD